MQRAPSSVIANKVFIYVTVTAAVACAGASFGGGSVAAALGLLPWFRDPPDPPLLLGFSGAVVKGDGGTATMTGAGASDAPALGLLWNDSRAVSALVGLSRGRSFTLSQ
jgi:hypothetical protein